MTLKREIIEQYRAAGFRLMPINGKRPILPKWTTRKVDLPPDHSGNYGIVLGLTDLVIDIDPRNFERGVYSSTILCQKLNLNLRGTFIVRSGSGGLHVYLKRPAGVPARVKKHIPDFAGLDFLTHGSFVVGPGSIHPDTGVEYAIAEGSPLGIKPADPKLLDFVDASTWICMDDREPVEDVGQYDRYCRYLKTAPEAVQGAHGDDTTYKVACTGKDMGLPPNMVLQALMDHYNPRCTPPWEGQELAVKVDAAFRYGKLPQGVQNITPDDFKDEPEQEEDEMAKFRWDQTRQGGIRITMLNTVNYFRMKKYGLKDMLRYNEMSLDIEFTRKAPWHKNRREATIWTDGEAINTKYHLSYHAEYEASVANIHEAAHVISLEKRYNPLCDWLNSLQWDGVHRMDTWLYTYAGVELSPYTQAVGRKCLLGAVARAFHPGCKFDYVMVLEGKQGTGKSTLVSVLGGEYYGDFYLDSHNKDTIDYMRGRWIIELSEMETQRRADMHALKAFLSRPIDRTRLAYARRAEDYPRRCIFIGTLNPDAGGYLKDIENRRFWPVATQSIDLPALRRDRDMLLAEAVVLFKESHEPLYLDDPEVARVAMIEADKRRMADPWLDRVVEFLLSLDEDEKERMVTTAQEIWEHAVGGQTVRFGKYEKGRIMAILVHELGWKPGRVYHPGMSRTVYGAARPDVDVWNQTLKELGYA